MSLLGGQADLDASSFPDTRQAGNHLEACPGFSHAGRIIQSAPVMTALVIMATGTGCPACAPGM